MKKEVQFIIVSLLLVTQTLFAGSKQLPEIKQIIGLTELTPEIIDDLMSDGVSDLAVQCDAGAELSPKLSWNFGFVSAMLKPNAQLKVDESFYFRVYKKKLYLSDDLVTWNKPRQWVGKKVLRKVQFSGDKSELQVDTSFTDYSPEDFDFNF